MKLSKSTKTVIIAAGVLLVLGVLMMVLLLTKPAEEETSEESVSSQPSTAVTITDKKSEDVKTLTVKNEKGEFTLDRAERVVTSTDADGNISSSTQVYWTSAQLLGVSPNDTTIKAFVNNMAGLSTKELVEENAEDLEKYGLEEPSARVEVEFTDGSTASLCFGIQNPAATNYAYFRLADSRDVHQVSYYSVGSAYNDIRDFAGLIMTEGYSQNNPKELDYLIIERKDFDEPVEIRYMFDMDELAEDEDAIITTFNSHRFITPIKTEVDTVKGQSLCYGVYGLSMSSCIELEQTEELMAKAGLDDPYCKVTFKYGGKRYVLRLGNEIVNVTESDSEDTPALKTVIGYYAMMEGVEGIYAISTDSAPWYTFTIGNVMSRRPVSPYIYTVDTIEMTTEQGSYLFKIEGDASSNRITCNGDEVKADGFRKLYQYLISSIGEDLYFEEQSEPFITVKFTYRDGYEDTYGTAEDVIEFYRSDDRKSIIAVNGTVLFKVREVYTDRLLENLQAVLDGGEVELNW